MTLFSIRGSKGGGSEPKPAVEAPDSLQSTAYARILDLVSEGEIKGLVDGMKSVFLDETPLQNADSSLNYSGVTLDSRTGSQDQDYITGYPAVESETSVGTELKSDQPWTHAVSNLQLSGIRIRLSTPRLSKTDSSNGNTNGYTVNYIIELATDGGAFVQVLASSFSGKTTTKYERTHRVDLPTAVSGWTVRVTRTTPNATSDTIADTTTIESYTEVIDAKLRYPGSALVGVQFDASQFTSIPSRSFDLYGRIIRVPSNYDPDTRVYAGVWDGTFKSAWSNNPAWIYYDLLLHFRYGLGHLLTDAQVDKWELYRIGQYCDQSVSDGKGGTEPRFVCNLYLSARADALAVLQDLATTFRGMSYWAGGVVTAVADMPDDPVYTYTNANIIDGKFNYVGSSKKSRFTVALVSWNDPTDFYRQKVQYVDDQDGIARYGIQQTEITATGCTSQAQAQRIGKWTLLTNRLETETVSFSVGLDGVIARPGQIIRCADNDRAGRRIGGRLRSSTLNTVVLDADVTAFPGDTITIIMPTGKAVSRVVSTVGIPVTWDNTSITWDNGDITMDTTGFSEDVQRVTFDQPLDALPPTFSIWAIDSPHLAVQQFRILSIAEDFSDTEMKFNVTAVKHVTSKFAAVDNGAKIDQPPVTVIPPSVQPPPANVVVDNDHFVDQGSAISVMTISWDKADSAIAYEVYWRKDDGDWLYAGRTGSTSVDVQGIYAGRYVAKVQAFNSLNIGSVFATSVETVLAGKTTPPPVVTSFIASSIIFAIRLNWTIPAGVGSADLQRTEIWYSETNDPTTAVKFGDYAYPQTDLTIMGLAAGTTFFFWARLVDRIGNLGAFYGPVQGQASTDAGPILDYLSDKITETQLSQELLAQIDSGGGAAVDIETIKSELAAMYTMKTQLTVDGVPYLAGIGIGVENDDGIITSQVLIAASRFAIVDPNVAGSVHYPFVLQGGVVYMDTAFIQDGTITNAKIGGAIQSTDYVANTSGWKLDKAGTIEFNGSVSGGGRLTITNRAVKVYDSAGTLRVQLGDLSA